jgi:molybdopterin converting factor small subunit
MSLHLTRNTFLGLVAAGSIGMGGLATLTAANASSAGTHEQQPRIEVTMRPWLAQQSGQRSAHLRLAYHAGISTAEVAKQAGLRAEEVGSIMAVRNGVQVELDTPLAAGDHLELITGMAGG